MDIIDSRTKLLTNIVRSNIFVSILCVHSKHFQKILCKSKHFHGRYRRKREWVFFLSEVLNTVYCCAVCIWINVFWLCSWQYWYEKRHSCRHHRLVNDSGWHGMRFLTDIIDIRDGVSSPQFEWFYLVIACFKWYFVAYRLVRLILAFLFVVIITFFFYFNVRLLYYK